MHHRLCGERLSERDPVDTAVGRQTRLGHHALTEHRHRPSAGTLVFAVPHLDIIRVHQAPSILARGAVQRIHAIENHLRLIHQLRVGFLQQIIAHKRANGKGNADSANGQQHNDASDQLGA